MSENNRTVVDYLWIEAVENGYKVGLTNEAQEELGNISFVTLPKVGKKLNKGDSFAELEAEKSVSEFASPLSGTIREVNEAADKNPSLLDDEDDSKAWLAIFEDVSE
ncbi:glycine cleavage system protein H [Enterococcus sp. BWR-S5]|uniref:glycine cleavage system protein H n=1 Tax=Enterococcus sp. BWR-S5 TaxID=2787714 RepID=UPI001920A857|nr:glycine cleavage system protein H [Enterococcus sp. BWR-S5]MBL1226540.1 glycine cleavage system protein H [Enterococcus sp. BWR-S5]